jgi:integrase
MYLEEINVTMPRQLTYAHCIGYLTWRKTPDARIGKYAAGHNTAVLELKFLALVMKHAVRSGFAPGNPCRELDLKREPARKYPQLKDHDIQMIVDGIQAEPPEKRAFLWPSFLIAYYHGVRLVETYLNPRTQVKLYPQHDGRRVGAITFFQKGNKKRVKPLHPELRALLFDDLLKAKAGVSFPLPKSFAKEWHNFFHRCGLKALKPNVCFHSFRVTVQNRLRRAGVPKEVRKAYLSHDGQDDVNARYDRIDDEDFGLDDFDMIDEMLACHAPLNRTWVVRPPRAFALRAGKPTSLRQRHTATRTRDGGVESQASPRDPTRPGR